MIILALVVGLVIGSFFGFTVMAIMSINRVNKQSEQIADYQHRMDALHSLCKLHKISTGINYDKKV